MNTEKLENEKEEVLKIVNEDWPMLEELGKKRFILNKKKGKDVEESLHILQSIVEEDNNLSEMKNRNSDDFSMMETTTIEIPVVKKVKDENIVVAKEVVKTPSSQPQKIATTTHSEFIEEKPIAQQQIASIKIEEPTQVIKKTVTKTIKEPIEQEKSLDLFKLIISGLTHLYVSKTSKLLKPMKFVMNNYREVSIAAIHLIVPLFITYVMTTQIGFVNEQLAKETMLMKSIYIGVFFFGATFVWISSQVLLSGIYAMLRKSMLEVAKVGKENK